MVVNELDFNDIEALIAMVEQNDLSAEEVIRGLAARHWRVRKMLEREIDQLKEAAIDRTLTFPD